MPRKGPPTPEETMQIFTEKQGWDRDSVIDVLLSFITDEGNHRDFAHYVAARALAENND